MGYPFSICSLFRCPSFPILSLFLCLGETETLWYCRNNCSEIQGWRTPVSPWWEVRAGAGFGWMSSLCYPLIEPPKPGIMSVFKQAGLTLLNGVIHFHGTEYRPTPLLHSAVGWKHGLSANLRLRIWCWILQEGPCTTEIPVTRSTDCELFWRLVFLPNSP